MVNSLSFNLNSVTLIICVIVWQIFYDQIRFHSLYSIISILNMRSKEVSSSPHGHRASLSKHPYTLHNKLLSKNVNQYTHFLKHAHTNQHDINWVLNLRSPSKKPKLSHIPDAPFESYYKTTESSQNKHTSADLTSGTDMNIYGSFVKQPIAHDIVNFSTSLRHSNANSREMQKRWNCIPWKDRTLFPRFLQKSSIKKVRGISDKDMENVYEGYLNYPEYSSKSMKQKNFNAFRHMAKGGKSYQGLCWQSSLRS